MWKTRQVRRLDESGFNAMTMVVTLIAVLISVIIGFALFSTLNSSRMLRNSREAVACALNPAGSGLRRFGVDEELEPLLFFRQRQGDVMPTAGEEARGAELLADLEGEDRRAGVGIGVDEGENSLSRVDENCGVDGERDIEPHVGVTGFHENFEPLQNWIFHR